jgi:hypothetical protein
LAGVEVGPAQFPAHVAPSSALKQLSQFSDILHIFNLKHPFDQFSAGRGAEDRSHPESERH